MPQTNNSNRLKFYCNSFIALVQNAATLLAQVAGLDVIFMLLGFMVLLAGPFIFTYVISIQALAVISFFIGLAMIVWGYKNGKIKQKNSPAPNDPSDATTIGKSTIESIEIYLTMRADKMKDQEQIEDYVKKTLTLLMEREMMLKVEIIKIKTLKKENKLIADIYKKGNKIEYFTFYALNVTGVIDTSATTISKYVKQLINPSPEKLSAWYAVLLNEEIYDCLHRDCYEQRQIGFDDYNLLNLTNPGSKKHSTINSYKILDTHQSPLNRSGRGGGSRLWYMEMN
jgi:hypothetical protein